ncbi:purine-nucleoside phosphorylase [Marinitenerispora sediminis]|uniref:purine-nucleoside phosphorylase n=1 Tax=Marinitenerispora sediminis TaxID=1931232 RepID=UPI002695B363
MSESTQDRYATAIAEPIDLAVRAAEELRIRTGADSYDALIVLGSGWASAADALGAPDLEIDISTLPGFVPPSAPGHSATARAVWVGAKLVLLYLGRTHLYDGYGARQVAHAVRTGIAAGASTVLLTSSAGSLRSDFALGQPILLHDHLNLTGRSPLLGPDYVDLSDVYSRRLREIALETDPSLAEGVYAQLPGPQFPTPSELRMLRTVGADLVGMSTALEAIAAVEMGADVLGLALAGYDPVTPTGRLVTADGVLAIARERAHDLGGLLNKILLRL